MIEGPHLFGFSLVAPCINLTSTLASVRVVSSVSESIHAETLTLVGLVLLSAIPPAFRILRRRIEPKEEAQPGRIVRATLRMTERPQHRLTRIRRKRFTQRHARSGPR
jgi:hypothetical protein